MDSESGNISEKFERKLHGRQLQIPSIISAAIFVEQYTDV